MTSGDRFMRFDVVVTPLVEPLTDLTRARLRGTIRREIAKGNVSHIVDLSGLSRLDVKTLAELIRMRRWLREVGGFLHLIVRQPDILKVLNVAGLDRVFGKRTIASHGNFPAAHTVYNDRKRGLSSQSATNRAGPAGQLRTVRFALTPQKPDATMFCVAKIQVPTLGGTKLRPFGRLETSACSLKTKQRKRE